MIVVKLGGSLLGSAELPIWLSAIASNSDGHVVIVPGGGVYADAVRAAQATAGFDDATAHQLALLAMDQYGLTLAALEPRLVIARSELEIAERSWQHRGTIWLPSQMVLAEEDIPQNWEATSDSLAAWLANRINAKNMLLVKSVLDASELPREQWHKQGLVDSLFDSFTQQSRYRVLCFGKNQHQLFATLLNGDIERMI